MRRKLNLFFMFALSALLLTMCRFYDQGQRVTPIEGLGCQPYTDYFEQGLKIADGLECYYTCPDGLVVGPFDFEGDPSTSTSKADLDRTLCSATTEVTSQATSTEPVAIMSPTAAASPTIPASPAAAISPIPSTPLLTGAITMCDQTTDLISFRIANPAPDLTATTMTVQISDIETTCVVNPVNTSLLTCALPASVIFPAQVVVSLDGVVVNDFTYDGVGCILVDTPIPTSVE